MNGMLLMSAGALWSKAWPILVAILFFGFIIIIHEFGHFVTAKLSGVTVHEFAIGMGPKLISFGKKETKYSLRLIPFGGFVSMEGEDEESESEGAFNRKPVWKRAIIISAGAIMNLLFGLILVIIMLSQQDLIATPKIADFQPNALSQQTGLQKDDVIKKINGTRLYSSRDLNFLMMRDKDGVFDFTVERNGEEVELHDVKFETEKQDNYLIIKYDFIVYGAPSNFWNSLKYSFGETVSIARMVWLSLFDLVTGQYGMADLSGPVGTVEIIADVATNYQVEQLISLMAFITINIGVFNLLPLPALDGGRLFFIIIEGIRRKPINPKYEGYVHAAGMVLLIGLMVFVTFNDILNLIRK